VYMKLTENIPLLTKRQEECKTEARKLVTVYWIIPAMPQAIIKATLQKVESTEKMH
jgi:hypothetical protein